MTATNKASSEGYGWRAGQNCKRGYGLGPVPLENGEGQLAEQGACKGGGSGGHAVGSLDRS